MKDNRSTKYSRAFKAYRLRLEGRPNTLQSYSCGRRKAPKKMVQMLRSEIVKRSQEALRILDEVDTI